MRIRRKPNYMCMSHREYLDSVLFELESKMTADGMGLLCAGYDGMVVTMMINDACRKFKVFNLSPKFTANQIINLLVEQNLETRKF